LRLNAGVIYLAL